MGVRPFSHHADFCRARLIVRAGSAHRDQSTLCQTAAINDACSFSSAGKKPRCLRFKRACSTCLTCHFMPEQGSDGAGASENSALQAHDTCESRSPSADRSSTTAAEAMEWLQDNLAQNVCSLYEAVTCVGQNLQIWRSAKAGRPRSFALNTFRHMQGVLWSSACRCPPAGEL